VQYRVAQISSIALALFNENTVATVLNAMAKLFFMSLLPLPILIF
jgi:hypothetical protein